MSEFIDLTMDGVMDSTPDLVYNDDPDYGSKFQFKPDNGGTPTEMEQVPPNKLKEMAMQSFKGRKPIYDWDTKNRSFVDTFKTLKLLGVKNNKFFLKLFDQELKGIDPFSPILPLEVKIRIQLECIINPWYWLRECCRIPVDGMPIEVGGGSPFLLDRNSAATWYLFLNGIDHYGSKPRQCGKTQDALAKFSYAYHYGTASSTILFFNKDSSQSRTNLYRLKCQRDMLPTYLQARIGFSEDTMKLVKERDNVTMMRNPINSNTIKTMPKATNGESAQKLGRGDTSSLQYYDEFDFTPYNTTILDSSAFTYSKASENAQKNGALYCRIFTSTPGNADDRDGKSANEFISHMLKWDESLFDEPITKVRNIVNSTSYNGIIFVEHTWKQLGKSMKWYEKQCNLVSYKQETILREIELKRISGSDRSPFSRETLMYLSSNQIEPKDSIDISDNFSKILLYETIHRDYPYILSVDPAQGLGQDNSAFVLINPYTLHIAAEFRSPYIAFDRFAQMLVKFMDEYCPKCMIVIENNRGFSLIQSLENTKYRYHIWQDEDRIGVLDKEKINKYGSQYIDAMRMRTKGFNTNSHTRPLLFNNLESMVNDNIERLNTKYLVQELLTLERKSGRGGRIEHADGEHDDVVLAYLIGVTVYYEANNLENWGIVRGMTEPVITGQESPEVMAQKMVNMLGTLPPEYKKMFASAMNQNDEVSNSEKYAREVQRESRRKRGLSPSEASLGYGLSDDFNDPMSDAWKEFDESLMNLNDSSTRSRRDPNQDYSSYFGSSDPLAGYDYMGLGNAQIGGGYNIRSGNDSYGGGSNPLDDFFNDL